MKSEKTRRERPGISLDRITTRTGDRGTTSLPGRSLPKHAPEFAAIGDIDELGACIGWTLASNLTPPVADSLRRVQSHLFEIGSLIASAKGALGFEAEIGWLEAWQQHLNDALPALNSFILSGGTEAAARLQVTRAVCRRAERSYWRLREEMTSKDDFEAPYVQAGVYLNRLSDLLFTLARHVNAEAGMQEPEWVPR